jgi:DNA-binding transcriptional LysR family regulator
MPNRHHVGRFREVELRHLQSFLAVYERGGFRAAAEAEHLGQPAVSRHIQALERDLGLTLFDRSPRGARPTAAGRAFYQRVEPMVRELLDAARSGSHFRKLEPLRVGYVAPALGSLVTELLDAVRREEPAAKVELTEATSPVICEGLRARTLDVGFLVGFDPTDLAVTPLLSLDYRLVVSRAHPLGRRRVVDLAELDDHTLISIAPREPTHQRILETVRSHAPRVRVQTAFGYQEVHGLVAAGLGVAAVPPGRDQPTVPGVTILRTRPALPGAELAVARRQRWRSPWSETVDSWIRQWRRDHPTALGSAVGAEAV